MSIAEKVLEAGVVGAGGAGFPTHVKMNSKADIALANGAECEPILRIDRWMMEKYPEKIIRGFKALIEATGAKEGVICLKKKNHDAIEILEKAIENEPDIRLYLLDNYYPAGDEQQIVYEVTGKVVPTGGIPLDVGAVVSNVSTLMNIADALDDMSVTEKYVTVGGEVEKPITVKVPIGVTVGELVKEAGGPESSEGYTLIIGGPATGRLSNDWNEPVTKTTGGVLVFKSDHPLIRKKTDDGSMDWKLAKAVCCQCNMCTELCPRNALGLGVEPHKAMRASFMSDGKLLGDPNGVFSCCDCGLCTYYACNFGLSPNRMIVKMKEGLQKSGYRPEKKVKTSVSPALSTIKVPTKRLMSRMGVVQYDKDTPLSEKLSATVDKVSIPLRMHIGAPGVPVVKAGDKVEKGQLIADIPEKSLGAKIHASIGGTVTDVTDKQILIKAN